jgi:DNA-binding transcriptional MerR regulator
MKKLYYSIGEISELLNEEQYTLRYWEKEFPIIKPHKNRGGNRVYSPIDFELLSLIHKLLREKNYNIKKISELFSSFNSKEEIIRAKENLASTIPSHKIHSANKINNHNKMMTLHSERALEIINDMLDILDE